MYVCQMPDCDYICENKTQINFHHIIPRSMGGSNKKYNLLQLCPNCHARVYVEGMTFGQHSIKHNNSIIFIGKVMSTSGLLISYRTIMDDTNEIRYSILK